NQWLYGSPIGIHAIVVTQGFSLYTKLVNAGRIFPILCRLLVETFPTVAVSLVCLACTIHRRRQPDGVGRRWSIELASLFVAAFFALTVPLILGPLELGGDGGTQWGPRFWLPLVPLLTLQATLSLQRLHAETGVLAILAASCLAVGLCQDRVGGPADL